MDAPTQIKLRQQSRLLQVDFADGLVVELPCEYLRVFSPSAEVRGHGGGEGTLVTGKRNVNIQRVEPVGNYAVRLCFDDGHDSGLFSWQALRALGEQYERNWRAYIKRLSQAGGSRESS